jgi:hypothetical protein
MDIVRVMGPRSADVREDEPQAWRSAADWATSVEPRAPQQQPGRGSHEDALGIAGPSAPRGELDSELRGGSPDPEASNGSAWSPTFIIPTKGSWTNCRYEGQGARAEGVGGELAGASTGGAAPVDAALAPDIDSQLLPANGEERGEARDAARVSATALGWAGSGGHGPHACNRPRFEALRDRPVAGDEMPTAGA